MRSSGCPRSGSPSTAVDTRGSVWGPVPSPVWSLVSGPLPGPVSGPLREARGCRCTHALTWRTRGAPRGPARADYFPTDPSPAPDVSTRSVDTLVLAHRLALQRALQLAVQVALQLASGLAVQLASTRRRPRSSRAAELGGQGAAGPFVSADYFCTAPLRSGRRTKSRLWSRSWSRLWCRLASHLTSHLWSRRPSRGRGSSPPATSTFGAISGDVARRLLPWDAPLGTAGWVKALHRAPCRTSTRAFSRTSWKALRRTPRHRGGRRRCSTADLRGRGAGLELVDADYFSAGPPGELRAVRSGVLDRARVRSTSCSWSCSPYRSGASFWTFWTAPSRARACPAAGRVPSVSSGLYASAREDERTNPYARPAGLLGSVTHNSLPAPAGPASGGTDISAPQLAARP